jgi:hypothetical protein
MPCDVTPKTVDDVVLAVVGKVFHKEGLITLDTTLDLLTGGAGLDNAASGLLYDNIRKALERDHNCTADVNDASVIFGAETVGDIADALKEQLEIKEPEDEDEVVITHPQAAAKPRASRKPAKPKTARKAKPAPRRAGANKSAKKARPTAARKAPRTTKKKTASRKK